MSDKAFYKSTAWKHKRKEILERDNYECQRCKAAGRYSRGVVPHHIEHLKARPDLALEDSNLLTVCEPCHNALHPEKLMAQQAAKRRRLTPERW